MAVAIALVTLLILNTQAHSAVSDTIVSRIVVLHAQADFADFPGVLGSPSAGLPGLANREAISRLQRIAELTQPPVRTRLLEMQVEGQIESFRSLWLINAFVVRAQLAVFGELAQWPEVVSIEEDAPIEYVEPVGPSERGRGRSLDSVEPGLRSIRAPEVWAMGITGAGVIVANTDFGVNGGHPALQNRWRGSFGYPWYHCWLDLAGTTTVPTQYSSHGTQTMGVQCGMVPGDTIGVAWGARWIASALNFVTLTSAAISAFEWMANPDSNLSTSDDFPRVISNSWGIVPGVVLPCYDVFNTVLDNLESAGIAVVFAAGNEGDLGPGTMRIPADGARSETSSFAVGAWNSGLDSLWSSSSQGPVSCSSDPSLQIKPELVAPGVNVRSAGSGSGYGTASGTSFSAPHVAGVIALMAEANPNLLPDSLKKILLWAAVDKQIPGNDNQSGYGLVDALESVEGALYGIGWMAGRVTNTWDSPIECEISFPRHPHRVRTNANGEFLFAMPALLPLTWQVIVPSYGLWTQTVSLAHADTLWTDVILAESRTGVLTGSVVDCDGNPAVNCSIELLGEAIPVIVTSSDGRFLFSLTEGIYTIHAFNNFCSDGYLSGVQILSGGVVDVELVLPFNPAHSCGAADEYGYTVCDNFDPNGPVCGWEEIAPEAGGLGVEHQVSNEPDRYRRVLLPFAVPFYGVIRERIYVQENGFAAFIPDASAASVNQALPTSSRPALYAFWDDLDPPLGGQIASHYDAGLARYVLEWHATVHDLDVSTPESFQIHILNPAAYPTVTGDAIIEYHYDDLSVLNSCTIGLDAGTGNGNFQQYVYNASYPTHASPLSHGLGIRFAPGAAPAERPALVVQNPGIGLFLSPGQSMDTALWISNQGTAPLAFHVTAPFDSVAAVYTVTDSRQGGGPPFSYFDISGVGTNTAIFADDSTIYPFALPWPFKFYDSWFERFGICVNGFINFTSGESPFNNSVGLETGFDPFCMIAPFWEDLYIPTGDPGRIITYFDEANDRFLIQWHNVRRYDVPSHRMNFQMVLWHDGRIDFSYAALTGTVNQCTVGLKGRTLTQVNQLVRDAPFVTSNSLVRFSPAGNNATASCAILDHNFAIVGPDSAVRVPVRLRNNTHAFGTFDCGVVVRSSDPACPALSAAVAVLNAPAQFDGRVVIAATSTAITLNWRAQNAPYYCIYSANLTDSLFTDFEAAVADTFYMLPAAPFSRRKFQVRMCEGPPVQGLASAAAPAEAK